MERGLTLILVQVRLFIPGDNFVSIYGKRTYFDIGPGRIIYTLFLFMERGLQHSRKLVRDLIPYFEYDRCSKVSKFNSELKYDKKINYNIILLFELFYKILGLCSFIYIKINIFNSPSFFSHILVEN